MLIVPESSTNNREEAQNGFFYQKENKIRIYTKKNSNYLFSSTKITHKIDIKKNK